MKNLLKIIFPIIAVWLFGYVWFVVIGDAGGTHAFWQPTASSLLIFNLFHLAGATAFTLVSLQIMTGPFMKYWEGLYGPNFYKFHAYEGITALLFASIHPLLVDTYIFMSHFSFIKFFGAYPWTWILGPMAWLCLVITVPTAASVVLFNWPAFAKKWHWLHLLNYLVFIFAFTHSMTIGTDLLRPDSRLRPLWWAFLVIGVLALVYRRIYRPSVKQDNLKE